jgi:predicted nucleic acid-binding protein
MSSGYLFDTDVIIDLLQSVPAIIELLETSLLKEHLAISLFTYGELYEGVIWGKDPERSLVTLGETLAKTEILPMTIETMRSFARLRGLLRRNGEMIGIGDLIIAATALEHERTLVTRNVRHFSRIPGLSILNPADTATHPPL